MFHAPENNHDFSLTLSKVLDDIGVNERMVMRRRRAMILDENVTTILTGIASYNFGSQSEGTTTFGLKSDSDLLVIVPGYNLIQDYAEWQQGRVNLMMIQDEETASGYCKLQMIRPDEPLPITDTLEQHSIRDDCNRILLKTSFIKDRFPFTGEGPASSQAGKPGVLACDVVPAFSCKSWPYEAIDCLNRISGLWLTADLKRYAESTGCMVVAAGSKNSDIQHLEWRISTCKAERCSMFNLNISQLRCYVLMKMIVKTYHLEPVTSFMCKTVLLHCIEISHPKEWRENNLFACLLFCLHRLYISVLHRSCPHFFIRRNNLMAGKISSADINKLKPNMRLIMQNLGQALVRVQIDDLGHRLQQSTYPENVHVLSSVVISNVISATLVRNLVNGLNNFWYGTELSLGRYYRMGLLQYAIKTLLKNLRLYREGNYIQKKAISFLVPTKCLLIGSVLASTNIGTNNSISPEAIRLLSIGLNTDVSSGRLKLASAFYCIGDMLRTEIILRETERLCCLDTVESMCFCFYCENIHNLEFGRVCYNLREKAIQRVCAFCIKFIRAEINCIPRELQYELFRSTEEDLQYKDGNDFWVDWAIVDSLPFLYFLQYKIYGCLHRNNEQLRALTNLVRTIFTDRNLGHRETALNLLGQCFEQENCPNNALKCYKMSLTIRKRNNAAKYHLFRVIGNMFYRL